MSKEIEDHRVLNNSHNVPFADVLARRVSRRGMMRGSAGLAAVSTQGATLSAQGQVRPRAATVVIEKQEGGPIAV